MAKVLYLMSGTLHLSPVLFDHILSLFCSFVLSRSMMFFSALLYMPLYIIVSVLYWIHCSTGSQ